MTLLSKINRKAKSNANTGFGTNATNYGGRFLNKEGAANIEKRGLSAFDKISWYHTLIDLPQWKFLGLLLGFYVGINLIFGLLYYAIGIEHLQGIKTTGSLLDQLAQVFFFSTQTFTTVGYGHISPTGFVASALSSLEALVGLLSFAIATGLFFGRFSKPKAHIKFAHHALIAPYADGKALMIRMSPYKNTNFTDAEAKMTLGMSVDEGGKLTNKFYSLDLEIDKINLLSLSWTLVHPINEESPLYGFSEDDFKNTQGEILVFIKTFDDMFSNVVAIRTSYTFSEVIYGAKFDTMFIRNPENTKTILHLDKLGKYTKTDLL